MYSFETVSDGMLHVVELLANGKNFTLRVDNGLARSIINEGVNEYLNVTAPLYLGGIENNSGQNALKLWHLRNLTSFKGCFNSVWINHKLVDFENSIKKEKTTPGCSLVKSPLIDYGNYVMNKPVTTTSTMPTVAVTKKHNVFNDYEISEEFHDYIFEEKDACLHNQCNQRGTEKCYATSEGDYACHCKIGFKGQFCEKELKQMQIQVIFMKYFAKKFLNFNTFCVYRGVAYVERNNFECN